jgi:hypothetical protein
MRYNVRKCAFTHLTHFIWTGGSTGMVLPLNLAVAKLLPSAA